MSCNLRPSRTGPGRLNNLGNQMMSILQKNKALVVLVAAFSILIAVGIIVS